MDGKKSVNEITHSCFSVCVCLCLLSSVFFLTDFAHLEIPSVGISGVALAVAESLPNIM